MTRRRKLILVGTLALMLGLAGLSVLVGAAGLNSTVVVNIRLPRIAVAAIAGLGLGAAGATLQGLFRNPLADGHLIGIAPAAGLGALVGYGVTPSGTVPLVVVILAVSAATAYSVWFGRIGLNQTLAGLALSLGGMAWLGVISLVWTNSRVPTLTYWLFGGLGASTWVMVFSAAPFVGVSLVMMVAQANSLDVLALGESEARHLGVPVERVRQFALVASGMAVGAAVSVSGVIAFIGLLAPLIMRKLLGPRHLPLIVGSALGGACLLLASDLAARTAASPIEVPVGLITSMFGAPVMAVLLMRRSNP